MNIHPEEARRESDIPEPDITDITVISENPEPEPEMIIILSSESETLSMRTEYNFGFVPNVSVLRNIKLDNKCCLVLILVLKKVEVVKLTSYLSQNNVP